MKNNVFICFCLNSGVFSMMASPLVSAFPEFTPDKLRKLTVAERNKLAALDLFQAQDDDISLLVNFPSLKELDLFGENISDQGLVTLGKLKQLKSLNLGKTRVTDSGLKQIKNLKNLEYLWLTQTSVTNAGLENLKEMRNLKTLGLPAQITAAGLRHVREISSLNNLDMGRSKECNNDCLKIIGSMPNLKFLSLRGWNITDDGLNNLRNEKLEELDLSLTPIKGAGLIHLAPMTRLKNLNLHSSGVQMNSPLGSSLSALEYLNLGNTATNDNGMIQISVLKNLKALILMDTRVTEKGIGYIKTLPKLEMLNLMRTSVGKDAVDSIIAMKSLKEIYVFRTKITESALRTIHEKRPDIRIHFN